MSNETNIRRAKADHNEKAILKLIKNGFGKDDLEFAERYYDKFFTDDTMTSEDEVFVAELENRIVGVIGYTRDYFSTDYSYWVGWFIVLEKFRKNNIGSKLLKAVESE